MKDKCLKLFTEYERLVPYIYNRYIIRTDEIYSHREDLLQEGYRALWQACLSYSADIGKPSTYFFYCIRGKMYAYINDFIRKYEYVLSTNQLYETLEEYESDRSNTSLSNLLSSTDRYFESDRVEQIVQVYKCYWSKQKSKAVKNRAKEDSVNTIRRIVTLLDLGFNQSEIARILNSTKQTINNKIITIQEALIAENYL